MFKESAATAADLTIVRKGDRWFSNSIGSFDGTARGYGYKTVRKLFASFYFQMQQSRGEELKKAAIQFLMDEPEIRNLLSRYFDEDDVFARLKRGEESTVYDFLTSSQTPEVLTKLKGAVLLHRSIERLFLGFLENPLKKYEIFGIPQVSVEESAPAR
jgi:hypothetical protein